MALAALSKELSIIGRLICRVSINKRPLGGRLGICIAVTHFEVYPIPPSLPEGFVFECT